MYTADTDTLNRFPLPPANVLRRYTARSKVYTSGGTEKKKIKIDKQVRPRVRATRARESHASCVYRAKKKQKKKKKLARTIH